MSREIGPGHERMFLFPPAIDDWVPDDHPARFIRALVESLDLDALGFKKRTSEKGRSNYGRELLLMVWLYLRNLRIEILMHNHLYLHYL